MFFTARMMLSAMSPHAVLLRYEDITFAGVATTQANEIIGLVRHRVGEVVK